MRCAGVPVLFSTSCGILRDTRNRCVSARLLLSQRCATFLEIDLAAQPAELQTLRLLQRENKLRGREVCRQLPMVFLGGRLLWGGEGAGARVPGALQELEDEGRLQASSSYTPTPCTRVEGR